MVHCIAVRFVKIELLFKLGILSLFKFIKHKRLSHATKVMNFGDNNRYNCVTSIPFDIGSRKITS